MSHFLYILYSKSKSKYYVGQTHDVEERILKHNQHLYSNAYTKIASDWALKVAIEIENKNDAVYLENFIKRMKSKKFIEKIIFDTSIARDILSKR